MKPTFRWLLLLLATVPAFSQEKSEKTVTETKSEARADGLVKIANPARNLNLDIRIDGLQLENTIEMAIRNALQSVEHSLDALQIHIEPIEINLRNLNTLAPIDIRIPNVEIEIEPLEIDLPDFDFDFDHDFDMDFDEDDHERDEHDKTLRKLEMKEDKAGKKNDKKDKDDSIKDKSEKEKAKGLKKVN